jgi:hypothetical protein
MPHDFVWLAGEGVMWVSSWKGGSWAGAIKGDDKFGNII